MKTKKSAARSLSVAIVRPLRRIARIRKGLYNYRGYNLYRTKREWVILGEDNEAYEYAPRRADLVRIIDRMERRPNGTGQETPLKQKIREAYWQSRQYHDMLTFCFPEPSAHRCATSGGPPACAMSFGRALREMGGSSTGMGSGRMVWLPSSPNKADMPSGPR